ncbi:MAG: 1-deoxy-D-xylulose-5-phosphate reductoisomerase, partial [Lachnospiraceae bacterium]|nr:1-deoxy-D-xylulose-5-phosphate reductoisomerase [Lachnospiraceae bacterium]
EEAVARFLDHKTGFLGIYEDIERAMSSCRVIENPSVDEILDAEKAAREAVRNG